MIGKSTEGRKYIMTKSYLQQETRISSEKSKRYFQTVTWIYVQ